jgi:hypothetical protein
MASGFSLPVGRSKERRERMQPDNSDEQRAGSIDASSSRGLPSAGSTGIRRVAEATLARAGLLESARDAMDRIRERKLKGTESRVQPGSILSHPVVGEMPNVRLVSQPASASSDEESVRRLLDAYGLAKERERTVQLGGPRDDVWTDILDTGFGDLPQILSDKDVSALSEYLLKFGVEYVGFGGLTLTVDGFTPQASEPEIALAYFDKLVCLAEAIGVLQLESPEQSWDWGANLHVDIDELVDGIEAALGISIVTPAGVVPVTGLATHKGPVHYRHINALYAALRVEALVGEDSAVCEYGGGIGLVAYYARQLGVRDYTIFDLPLTNLFAGYFLLRALGPDAVCLYGEESRAGTVRVLPYWECVDAPAASFGLSLNQDSFPEIDPALVAEYLRQIHRTTTKCFLSINQEAEAPMGTRSQNSVPDLVQASGAYRREYRMKYWVREGYVEELYRPV